MCGVLAGLSDAVVTIVGSWPCEPKQLTSSWLGRALVQNPHDDGAPYIHSECRQDFKNHPVTRESIDLLSTTEVHMRNGRFKRHKNPSGIRQSA